MLPPLLQFCVVLLGKTSAVLFCPFWILQTFSLTSAGPFLTDYVVWLAWNFVDMSLCAVIIGHCYFRNSISVFSGQSHCCLPMSDFAAKSAVRHSSPLFVHMAPSEVIHFSSKFAYLLRETRGRVTHPTTSHIKIHIRQGFIHIVWFYLQHIWGKG